MGTRSVSPTRLARGRSYWIKQVRPASAPGQRETQRRLLIALTALGAVREILGNGSLFEFRFVPEDANTLILFILPPGAFIALAYLAIVFNRLTRKVA